MADVAQIPQWMRNLDFSRMVLYPGASLEAIARLEEQLGIYLPERYREFMLVTDGIYVTDARNSTELFPIGNGDIEPLKVINRERPTVGRLYTVNRAMPYGDPTDPMLLIGDIEDEDGDVGFLMSELGVGRSDTLPVWHYMEGEYCWTAPTFEEFVAGLCKIKPGGAYVDSMSGRNPVCWKPASDRRTG